MQPAEFKRKWSSALLTERASAQQHFLDLCSLVGMPPPADYDPSGNVFAFERAVSKAGGGKGFADVWFRDHFAMEYKGPGADLDRAYQQLLLYRDDLDNPPLLVVSDLRRILIHTNFTRAPKRVHEIDLDSIDQPDSQRTLRALFFDPDLLHPRVTVSEVTEAAAERVANVARLLEARGVEPQRAAHFLVQAFFCLFAEDAGLLPKKLFSRLVAFHRKQPEGFAANAAALFASMRDGTPFALEVVPKFNGGLFVDIDPLDLNADELGALDDAANLDWSGVEPAIFGTLSERALDPAQRSRLGVHYTGREDIERVAEPVVLEPLRREWRAVRGDALAVLNGDGRHAKLSVAKRQDEFRLRLQAFQDRLASVRVLDPACGSGNFLYVALSGLMTLEKEVIVFGTLNGLPQMMPLVGPRQVLGLEINPYARELAQVVVWIGFLQWRLDNGFGWSEPVLAPLETIRLQDALLDLTDPEQPKEATWPEAEFIVGNPPFLGDKKMRGELGDEYVATLRRVFRGSVAGGADLSAYFFERARSQIAQGKAKRAGLLATQTIRKGASRAVLDAIKQSGDIFLAWGDLPWLIEGAHVRISIVGFDDGSEPTRMLDGLPVAAINADLTADSDVASAVRLIENSRLAFFGDCKGGPFDVDADTAAAWLKLPLNPNGRPNSDVVKRRTNGRALMQGDTDGWIVDFGPSMTEGEAALYEAPFEHVLRHVKPVRDVNRDTHLRRYWWLHQRPRPEMREAIAGLDRFFATPTVSKHRVLAWVPVVVLPDHKLIVFARSDDYFFGVLHSRCHEVWSLRMAARHGVGNDPVYNIQSCFETFPLPWPPGTEPSNDPRVQAIAAAAADLSARREAWLNPEGASEADLKKRTLTNLYNQRPAWLDHLHIALDRAVWAAYGWTGDPIFTSDEEILSRLLALNGERAAKSR